MYLKCIAYGIKYLTGVLKTVRMLPVPSYVPNSVCIHRCDANLLFGSATWMSSKPGGYTICLKPGMTVDVPEHTNELPMSVMWRWELCELPYELLVHKTLVPLVEDDAAPCISLKKGAHQGEELFTSPIAYHESLLFVFIRQELVSW